MRDADTCVWVDRVKNIIKLAQGEYVSVSRLEEIYVGNSPAIRQMYIYGNSLRSYLVAVVVPSIGAWAIRYVPCWTEAWLPLNLQLFMCAEIGHLYKLILILLVYCR